MTTSSDEARLIQRAQQGDPDAFAEIYERHQAAVYRYVYYRTNDTATAEDLTGAVFVRMVEKIDGFVYRNRPFLAWLYTIARNMVIDYQRRAGQAIMLPLDEHLLSEGEDVEEAAERALTQRQVAAALAYLSEDQRQVILLKFMEEMSNDEVARALGKSVGAVKALQWRALGVLRRVLQESNL